MEFLTEIHKDLMLCQLNKNKSYAVLVLFFSYFSVGSIRVYCRVRPFLPGQVSPSTVASIDEGNITIVNPKSGKEGQKTFSFNKVFGPSATQGFLHCTHFCLIL
jgi:hypothetical protein